MSSHSLCEKMFTRDWKIFIEWKWMKFHKKHNNPPALFKYLSQGEDGGEVTAWTLCSNVITSQLWLTLNLGHPTLPSRGARGGQGRRGEDRPLQVGGSSRCRDCGHSLLDIMTRSADIQRTDRVTDWAVSDVVTQTDEDFRNKTQSDGKLLEWLVVNCLSPKSIEIRDEGYWENVHVIVRDHLWSSSRHGVRIFWIILENLSHYWDKLMCLFDLDEIIPVTSGKPILGKLDNLFEYLYWSFFFLFKFLFVFSLINLKIFEIPELQIFGVIHMKVWNSKENQIQILIQPKKFDESLTHRCVDRILKLIKSSQHNSGIF